MKSSETEASKAAQAWKRFLYGDSRLGNEIIGTSETLQNMTSADLAAFYKKWYVPSRMVLVIAGDVNWQQLSHDIEQAFDSLKPKTPSEVSPLGEVDRFGTRIFVQPRPVSSATVSIIMLYPAIQRSDNRKNRREEFIELIGQFAIQRRLDRRIEREPKLWTSAVFANISDDLLTPVVIFRASTDGSRWKEALSALNEELLRAKEYGLTPQELRAAKNEISALLKRQIKSSTSWSNEHFANALVSHINNAEVFTDVKAESDFFEQSKDGISLTEVNSALRELLSVENRRLKVSGNVQVEDIAVRKYWESIENMPVSAPEESDEIVFPYLDVPDEVPPASPLEPLKLSVEDRHVTAWTGTLANGIKVVLLPVAFDKSTVSVEMIFGDGLLGVKDTASLRARSALMVLSEHGVGKLTANETETKLGTQGVYVVENAVENYNYILGAGPVDDTALVIESVWTQFMDPTLTADNLTRATQRLKQSVFYRDKTVEGYVASRLQSFVGGDLLRMRPLDAGELSGMSVQQMQDYINEVRDRGQRVVVVSGNINKDAIYPIVNRFFSTLPASVPGQKLGSEPRFPAGADRTVTLAEDKQDTAIYTVVWYREKEDFSRIREVAARIISADIIEDRLRNKLREEEGVSYSPNASYDANAMTQRGYLLVNVQTGSGQIEKVKAGIEQITAELETKGVTKEEVDNAVKAMVNRFNRNTSQNIFWQQLLVNQLTGAKVGPDFTTDLLKACKALTTGDINKELTVLFKNPSAKLLVKAGDKPE